MATKKAAELFGDDGANGPRAPISQSPAPGLGPNNRAVGFGEDLTSFTANRMTYALALNDDDLDLRVRAFEEGGLDGVYRLGALDVAGGGRRIHLDGGAVEGWTDLGETYAADVANALFRATSLNDTIDGAIAFDAVSNAGLGLVQGAALFSLLDRRALALSTSRTVFAEQQGALLNENNAGPDRITLINTGRWGLGGATDLLVGIDMVEIPTGAHAGLYVLKAILEDDVAQVVTLAGEAPVFGTDSEVNLRLFRPVVSAAGRSGSTRLSHGLRVVGLPGDEDAPNGVARGALELVPGGRNGLASVVPDEGLRYALRTEVHGANAADVAYSGSITATGGFEAEALDHMKADQKSVFDFGWPGFRYSASNSGVSSPIGYLAHNQRAGSLFYGQMVVSQETRVFEGTLAAGDRVHYPPQYVAPPLYYKMGHPGALVEVTINGEPRGLFRVFRCAYTTQFKTAPLAVMLRHLDGSVPALEPLNSLVGLRFFSGVVAGRTVIPSTSPLPGVTTNSTPHVCSMEITAPSMVAEGEVPVALNLSTHEHKFGYTLRATAGNYGTVFSIDGEKAYAKKLEAEQAAVGGLSVGSIVFSQPVAMVDVPIPMSCWKSDHIIQQYILSSGYEQVGWGWAEGELPGQPGTYLGSYKLFGPLLGTPRTYLHVPLSGVLPNFAQVKKLRVVYRSVKREDDTSPFPSYMRMRLIQQHTEHGEITVLNEQDLPVIVVADGQGFPLAEATIDVAALGYYTVGRYEQGMTLQFYNINSRQQVDFPWGGNHVHSVHVDYEYLEIGT